jgi:hypothetical protein
MLNLSTKIIDLFIKNHLQTNTGTGPLWITNIHETRYHKTKICLVRRICHVTQKNVTILGRCFPVTLLAESLRIFTDLAVGETAASLSTAKVECGKGRNTAAAKSLKITVTETPK